MDSSSSASSQRSSPSTTPRLLCGVRRGWRALSIASSEHDGLKFVLDNYLVEQFEQAYADRVHPGLPGTRALRDERNSFEHDSSN